MFRKKTIRKFYPLSTYFRGNHVVAENTTLIDLLCYAYGLNVRQIANPPSWFASQRFDVDGLTSTEGRLNREQARLMLQNLLAERFHLAFHHEQRPLPVYLVTLASSTARNNQTPTKRSLRHALERR